MVKTLTDSAEEKHLPAHRREGYIPPLQNGDHLDAEEFMRRYEAMPDLKKAELINGIVYMTTPVGYTFHAVPDSFLQGWLFNYSLATPGTEVAANPSMILSESEIPQPDSVLRIRETHGGLSRISEKAMLEGPPELVIEIAASSVSIDLNRKKESYCAAGVREYLVYRSEDEVVDWWSLREGAYSPLPTNDSGVIRSEFFPGLWLDIPALLEQDGKALMKTLQQGIASEEHASFSARMKAAAQP